MSTRIRVLRRVALVVRISMLRLPLSREDSRFILTDSIWLGIMTKVMLRVTKASRVDAFCVF